MTNIDSEVLRHLNQARGGSVPIIITCGDECESVVEALNRARILVTNTGSMVLGSIGASITADQLDVLKSIPAIYAVEHDKEAHILNR